MEDMKGIDHVVDLGMDLKVYVCACNRDSYDWWVLCA
jgi:hypothetical protein